MTIDRPSTPRSFRLRVFLLALFAAWLAAGARAATLGGASLPNTYSVDGRPLILNGIGLRTLTIFKIRAYVAGLYLQRPNQDAQQILTSAEPKVVLLKFIHSASKQRVERQYRAGEATNCGAGGCDPSDETDFERLVAAAPAVNPGDTSTYVFTGRTVRVFANDQLIDQFTNRDLAYRLLAGFIGNHPPSEDLKRGLLGLPSG